MKIIWEHLQNNIKNSCGKFIAIVQELFEKHNKEQSLNPTSKIPIAQSTGVSVCWLFRNVLQSREWQVNFTSLQLEEEEEEEI